MKNCAIGPMMGILLMVVVAVVMVFAFTHLSSHLSNLIRGSKPLAAIVDLKAYYVKGLNKTVIVLNHLGGEPIPLDDLKVVIQSKSGTKCAVTGSGFVSLIGYYYRLNKTAMGDGNAVNPNDVKFSELVFTRRDKSIFFDWSDGGPDDNLTDYFGVVWEGKLKVVENGSYTFTLTSDDGSWLWIDGNLIINNGGLHGAQSKSNTIYLTKGFHDVKVMMYEWEGSAVCKLTWMGPNVSSPTPVLIGETSKKTLYAGDSAKIVFDVSASDPVLIKLIYVPAKQVLCSKEITPVSVTPKSGFIAYYYSDPNWSNLVATRVEKRIRFASKESGYDSDVPDWPKPIIGKNKGFSVRWVGYIYVKEEDNYTFYLTVEDDGWLYIDDKLVVENYNMAGIQEVHETVHLTKGYHKLELWMKCIYGYPVAILKWNRGGVPVITDFLEGNWICYYYNGTNFNSFVTKDGPYNRLRFSDGEDTSRNWDSDIPNWPLNITHRTDNFSVICKATITLPEGYYTFNLTSDDGSRLYIDGNLVVDNWGDHGPRSRWGVRYLSSGDHTFEVRMYENGGGALLYLQYARGVYTMPEFVRAYNIY